VALCVFVALVVLSIRLATLMVRAWDRAVDDQGQLRVAAAEAADLRRVALHRAADRAASGLGPTAIDTVNA